MAARRVQLGFCMPAVIPESPARGRFVDDLERALELVSGHFHGAWIVDHLQGEPVVSLEGFTALTYLAARHPRLAFGHSVLCQSFRNPALVAKMAATLQLLSGGRFILGMGAGWDETEYRAYGYDFPPAGRRVAQLDEALRLIKGLWTRERFSFTGQYYRVQDAICEPRPDPVPTVVIGAFRPQMLRVTARHGDWWDVSSIGVETYRRTVQEFEHACEVVGRDPSTVRRSWSGGCACGRTRTEAETLAGDRVHADAEDDFGFVGTPAQVVEQMRPFIALGVDYFILDCSGFPNLTTLELLVDQVLPVLNNNG